MKVILIFALTCFTAAALAQQVSKPPQPIGTKPAAPIGSRLMRYSELKSRFDVGVQVTEVSLSGRWQIIAKATTVNCGKKATNSADANGLDNGDGSKMMLEFGRFPDTTQPGGPYLFGVKVSNFGVRNVNQGPYKSSGTEPQFSTWSYPEDQTNFYSWTCRADAVDQTVLVCAASLVEAPPPDNNCSKDAHGIVLGFKKLP